MREFCMCVSNDNQGVTPFETIDAIKEAGFKNVFIQWYNKEWECSQEDQLKYIRQLGLTILFAHLGYRGINSIWEDGIKGDILVAKYKEDIDECFYNDIPMIVMHLTSGTKAPIYSEIGLNRLRQIIEHAKKYNIKVAFENTKIKGYLDYVITNIKDDNVGICYDSGHVHAHFNDEFNFELFKDRIFAVHLHDNDHSKDLHLMPFDGTIDWDELIQDLKNSNYSGPITLELCYRYEYTKSSLIDFYKKGYLTAQKISKIFEE